MAMGSSKSPQMVKRYAHHHAKSMRPQAQVIDDVLSGVLTGVSGRVAVPGDTISAQEEKSPLTVPLRAVG